MTVRLVATFLLLALVALGEDYANLADPFVGTDNTKEFSHGNLYPCIGLPWGMNSWTPQTRPAGQGWLYDWKDRTFLGLHQTHQPSPWIGDYGQFTILATARKPQLHENRRVAIFSHDQEEAKPYFYKVTLSDGVRMELAPTERAAILRITYPETATPGFVFDALDGDAEVHYDAATQTLSGYVTRRFVRWNEKDRLRAKPKNHFILRFDRKIADRQLIGGERKGALLTFEPTRPGETVEVRIASSFISLEQANRNLGELGAGDYETVKTAARKRWNEGLSRVRVKGGTEQERKMFYTCLYRVMLFPRRLHEYDPDGKPIHQSVYGKGLRPGVFYTDTGFWDTFRAHLPLINRLFPEIGREVALGLINTLDESGWIPEWASPDHRACMIGQNSASIVADAYFCGLLDQAEAQILYAGLIKGANAVHPDIPTLGRPGFEEYNRLGYIPCDGATTSQSVSRTLEYAYADWCIAKLGEALDRPNQEVERYRKRSTNWCNVFDPKRRLAVARKMDGTFEQDFNPFRWGYAYTEGNALHYSWSVFHDLDGLADAMGGRQALRTRLDELFTLPPTFDGSFFGGNTHEIREMVAAGFGQYAHGNEPVHHVIYLYDWLGDQKTAGAKAHEVMKRLYSPTPDGFCGDEDTGQMSAWYVWSAIGLYPINPPSGRLARGQMLFDAVETDSPVLKQALEQKSP